MTFICYLLTFSFWVTKWGKRYRIDRRDRRVIKGLLLSCRQGRKEWREEGRKRERSQKTLPRLTLTTEADPWWLTHKQTPLAQQKATDRSISDAPPPVVRGPVVDLSRCPSHSGVKNTPCRSYNTREHVHICLWKCYNPYPSNNTS